MAIFNRIFQRRTQPQIDIIKPPVKRNLIVFSAIRETRSIVIICADRNLAIDLNNTYGRDELLDWVHRDMYEMIVSDLYDFNDVVQYIKARYE